MGPPGIRIKIGYGLSFHPDDVVLLGRKERQLVQFIGPHLQKLARNPGMGRLSAGNDRWWVTRRRGNWLVFVEQHGSRFLQRYHSSALIWRTVNHNDARSHATL